MTENTRRTQPRGIKGSVLQEIYEKLGLKVITEEELERFEGGAGPTIMMFPGPLQNLRMPGPIEEDVEAEEDDSEAIHALRIAAMKPLEEIPDERLEFQGTLMEGPSICIGKLAHWDVSNADWDAIWRVTNPRDLLLESGVEEYIEEEVDIPLYSDVFYTYITSSQRGLAEALREVMLDLLEK